MLADRLDPGAGQSADGDHRHAGRDRLELRLERVRVAQIHLGQDDHRCRPALVGDRQQPLDAAQVEICVCGGRDKDDVDVGRDDLRRRFAARRLPGDGGLSRQDGANLARARRVVYGHPVTNRDQSGVPQGATERGQRRTAGKLHEEFGAVVGRQPTGPHALVAEGIECGRESLVPAKHVQLGPVV